MAEETSHEDRTEEPTQRRVDEAIARGDVPRSAELPVFMGLGALTLSLVLLPAFGAASRFALDLRGFLMNAHQVPEGAVGLRLVANQAVAAALTALAVPVGLAVAAALAAGLVQHRPVLSTESLMPNLARLSPLGGLKRLLGRQALGQFAKGLAKLTIVSVLLGVILWNERDRFEGMVGQEPGQMLSASLTLGLKLLGAALALHALVTAADVLAARFGWMRRLRMTREEVKREHKEQEGNPEIKAKIRQLRAQAAKKRMMTAVPKATVVVTNPTHYAVALRYEPGMGAPICVAKGQDHMALRIRAIAGDHNVPLVENPPLARALHASVEVDGEIPVEHYRAVAEVIGFVLRLKRRAS